MVRHHVDPLALVSGFFLFFMLYNILQDTQSSRPELIANSSSSVKLVSSPFQDNSFPDPVIVQQDAGLQELNIDALSPPYENYAVTQGPHGFSYGHAAIDLSAGRGAVILSPINGSVTQIYVDDLGNTTLVIENDHYQVIMLHGIYTVAVGDVVKLGQPVGQESNQGNTVDALGNSCRGRDCGYHTHLNVYDKILGVNINPLQLWQ